MSVLLRNDVESVVKKEALHSKNNVFVYITDFMVTVYYVTM